MKDENNKSIWSLFFSFLKVGAFTFGGGYAMVALLENEFVQKKKWLDKTEFLDVVAIAESTPGPVAINSATYIGYKNKGVLGSVAATLAVSLPSFIIIYIISLFFDAFIALEWVGYAFNGIQVCVVYLILSAGLRMLKDVKRDCGSIVILIAVFILSVLFSVLSVSFSSVFFILLSGLFYLALSSINRVLGKEEEV